MDWDDDYYTGVRGGMSFERGLHGYECFTHNLGYNTYHLVAVSKRPGFMAVLDDESVWQQLCDGRFTTPIVREWAGYVRETMVETELIIKARSFGCDCAYMIAADGDLDDIVQGGLKHGILNIR